MVAATSKASKKKPAAADPPAPRPIDTIRVELQNARDKLAEESARNSYMKDTDRLQAKVDQLAAELDLAIAQQATGPAMAMAVPKPMYEGDIDVALIELVRNHRTVEHEAETIRLALTMKEVGQLVPIAVRSKEATEVPKDGKLRAELIFGSRRLAAAKLNGWTSIRARVFSSDLTADQLELMRSIENLHHASLNPVERALSVAMVIDQVKARMEAGVKGDASGGDASGFDLGMVVANAGGVEAYVGQLLGQDPAWVRDHGYVAKLGGRARELLTAARLDLGHARELAKIHDPRESDGLAEDVARGADGTGGKSVAETAQLVSNHLRSLKVVPWRLDVPFGLLKLACAGCPHNTQSEPLLFEHDSTETQQTLNAKAGTCMYAACFASKQRATEQAITTNAPKVAKVDTIAHTPAALVAEKKVPPIVKPETFSRAVKKISDPPAPKPRSTTSNGSSHADKKDPAHEARKRYEDKACEWAEPIAKKLLAAIAKKPGATALFYVLSGTLLSDLELSYYEWNRPDDAEKQYQAKLASVKRVFGMTRTEGLLECLRAPTFNSFVELEKDIDLRNSFQNVADPMELLTGLYPPVLVKLATDFKIEHDAPPDREAMVAAAVKPPEKPAAKGDTGVTPPKASKKKALAGAR